MMVAKGKIESGEYLSITFGSINIELASSSLSMEELINVAFTIKQNLYDNSNHKEVRGVG